MKRRDVIKTFEHVKISRIFGKPASETNDWLHGIFVLLYGIAEALDVFEDDDSSSEAWASATTATISRIRICLNCQRKERNKSFTVITMELIFEFAVVATLLWIATEVQAIRKNHQKKED